MSIVFRSSCVKVLHCAREYVAMRYGVNVYTIRVLLARADFAYGTGITRVRCRYQMHVQPLLLPLICYHACSRIEDCKTLLSRHINLIQNTNNIIRHALLHLFTLFR